MEASKVTLSEAEHRLLTDAAVILTKNSVIDKVCQLFGELGNRFYEISAALREAYPSIYQPHPKVSKGEKHQDLPWVMLDYPRYFAREGHIAIRCFCWWGRYYSIQLQVSGNYLSSFIQAYTLSLQSQPSGWFAGLTHDPWDLQLPPTRWQEISQQSPTDESVYFKMAKKIPISEWEQLENILTNYFEELKQLMEIALRHQSGETVL
jgi:hypothetical protein